MYLTTAYNLETSVAVSVIEVAHMFSQCINMIEEKRAMTLYAWLLKLINVFA